MFHSTHEYKGGKSKGPTKGGPRANKPNRASHFKNEERYKDYQKATKGLDQEVAWKALTGDSGKRGQSFGSSDRERYDALMRAKTQKDKPKEEPKAETSVSATVQLKEGRSFDGKGEEGVSKIAVQPEKGRSFDGKGGGTNNVKPQNQVPSQTIFQTAPTSAPKSASRNVQTQNVNQDNDINSKVTGNNNTVINEQDNSIRQYGGDNRSFTYNGGSGGNRYEDTPVSAATMSGFYDVNDSPAAQAGFVDMYKDFNKDNSTRFAGEAMKTMAMFNMDARDYTPESMENAIGKSTQYSFDRADRQTGHVFGDIWNPNYITEEWKMPSAPGKIESNAEEIAKKAKDDIDDV